MLKRQNTVAGLLAIHPKRPVIIQVSGPCFDLEACRAVIEIGRVGRYATHIKDVD